MIELPSMNLQNSAERVAAMVLTSDSGSCKNETKQPRRWLAIVSWSKHFPISTILSASMNLILQALSSTQFFIKVNKYALLF